MLLNYEALKIEVYRHYNTESTGLCAELWFQREVVVCNCFWLGMHVPSLPMLPALTIIAYDEPEAH